MKTIARRRPTALVALTAGALCFGITLPAFGADGNYTNDVTSPSGPAISAIQQDQGSLTVHKYEQPAADTNLPNDGMALNPEKLADLVPLEGIKFRVQRVKDVDLKTQAGWAAVANYMKEIKGGTYANAEALGKDLAGKGLLVDSAEQLTTGDGSARFAGLPIGLYYVTEDLAGSTNAKKGSITPAAPFFITVPLTNTQTRDRWVYNVHVYPKNSITGATKAVNDEGTLAVGQELTYTLLTEVPRVDALKRYVVLDRLDANLTYQESAEVTLVNGDAASSVTLDSGDYQVTAPKASFSGNSGQTQVTVTFTEAGLKKLVQARKADGATLRVKVVIRAVVKSIPADGLIKNKAFLIPNESGNENDPEPGTPTNEVISKFGKIKLTKISSLEESTKLDNAIFQVKPCKIKNEDVDKLNVNSASAFGIDVKPEAIAEDALTVNGQKDFKTVAGTLTIDALRYNDWKNQSDKKAGQVDLRNPAEYGQYNAYCLVETQAPEGYELLPAPVPFLVTMKTMADSADATLPVTIKNMPKNGGFHLPVTGGTGIALAGTLGAALVGSGVLIAATRRKGNK